MRSQCGEVRGRQPRLILSHARARAIPGVPKCPGQISRHQAQHEHLWLFGLQHELQWIRLSGSYATMLGFATLLADVT